MGVCGCMWVGGWVGISRQIIHTHLRHTDNIIDMQGHRGFCLKFLPQQTLRFDSENLLAGLMHCENTHIDTCVAPYTQNQIGKPPQSHVFVHTPKPALCPRCDSIRRISKWLRGYLVWWWWLNTHATKKKSFEQSYIKYTRTR